MYPPNWGSSSSGSIDSPSTLNISGRCACGLPLGDPREDEVHARFNLLHETYLEEDIDGEGRIADPRVSIIPVVGAANVLRERECWCENDGAHRLVCEKLESEEVAFDFFLHVTSVCAFADPISLKLIDFALVSLCCLGQSVETCFTYVRHLNNDLLALVESECSLNLVVFAMPIPSYGLEPLGCLLTTGM
jgi:hypothetical protein